MSDNNDINRSIIDRNSLPPMFPTHKHTPQFWEHLGRTIATFGFLEETLGKAVFAFTATRRYSPDEANIAYEEWIPTLEKALTNQLWNLAEKYGKAVKENPESITENIEALVNAIKELTVIRNVLCHGSWTNTVENDTSVPKFVNKDLELFTGVVDIDYLRKVQASTVELACTVMDTVTCMGWQFPGGAGPGKPIV